jgi:hypothetical protein
MLSRRGSFAAQGSQSGSFKSVKPPRRRSSLNHYDRENSLSADISNAIKPNGKHLIIWFANFLFANATDILLDISKQVLSRWTFLKDPNYLQMRTGQERK